jgi:hypothetical protein
MAVKLDENGTCVALLGLYVSHCANVMSCSGERMRRTCACWTSHASSSLRSLTSSATPSRYDTFSLFIASTSRQLLDIVVHLGRFGERNVGQRDSDQGSSCLISPHLPHHHAGRLFRAATNKASHSRPACTLEALFALYPSGTL